MQDLFIDASVALLLTSIFAFRFRTWNNPLLLSGYFAAFFALEWIAKRIFILPGTIGLELAFACLGLALLFAMASVGLARWEQKQSESD